MNINENVKNSGFFEKNAAMHVVIPSVIQFKKSFCTRVRGLLDISCTPRIISSGCQIVQLNHQNAKKIVFSKINLC